jgi:hypothetical protein
MNDPSTSQPHPRPALGRKLRLGKTSLACYALASLFGGAALAQGVAAGLSS